MLQRKSNPGCIGLDWFGERPRVLVLQQGVSGMVITQCFQASTFQSLTLPLLPLPLAIALPDQQIRHKSFLLDATLRAADIDLLFQDQMSYYLGEGEWQIDYCQGALDSSQKDQQCVQVVATSKTYLQSVLEVLSGLKRRPNIVDIESYALARCIHYLFPCSPSTFVIYHCHPKKIYCSIFEKDIVIYTQEILLDASFTVMLHQSWLLFKANFPEKKISIGYVLGSDPALKKRKKMLEEILRIPMEIANPFSKLTVDEAVNKTIDHNTGPAFALACGLALRGDEHSYD